MMLRVRLFGRDFVLTSGDLENGGPIATADQYQSGRPSFAHLFPDGRILRYGGVIGRREDLERVGEIDDLEPDSISEALTNILDEDLWRRPE